MTKEEAKKMLKAKLECLKRETSGTDIDCNYRNCDECNLCYEQGNMGEQKEALDMAIKALEQIRWIPVSERLPDIKEHHVSEPCIVYCENGAYGFAELEENIFGQVGWDCERDDEYHEPLGEVLAWMPLPTSYQGEENG